MVRKYNLVVDTNVFLHGFNNFSESASDVVDLIEANKVNLVFTGDTFGELIFMIKCWARKNITSKKDRLSLLHDFVDLFYNSLSYNPTGVECPKINDEFDIKFLECAIVSKCDFLISNDYSSGMHKVDKCNFIATDTKSFMDMWNGVSKKIAIGDVDKDNNLNK